MFEVKTNGKNTRRLDRTSVIIKLKVRIFFFLHKYKYKTKKSKYVKYENVKKGCQLINKKTFHKWRVKLVLALFKIVKFLVRSLGTQECFFVLYLYLCKIFIFRLLA